MARDDRPASAMAILWILARNQIAGGIGLSLVGPSAILSISTANRRRQATSGLVWLAYMLAQVVAKGLRGIDRGQVVRDRHEPAGLGDHHFGVSAIMMNAGIFLVPAVHEIAVAAELAIAARPAEKPDTHALTDHPALNARTKRIDPPDDLMAWDARPFDQNRASTVPESEWQTPHASTRIHTLP